MTEQPSPSRDSRRRARRRVVCVILVFGVLFATLFLHASARVRVGTWRAKACLHNRDSEKALDWLLWARSGDSANSQIEFLLARAYRKQNEIEKAIHHLDQARTLGYDAEQLRREGLFLDAQCGRLKDVVGQFASLFVDQRDDGAEICEAYVIGCIQDYAFAEANTVLDLWQQDFPSDAQPHFLRGRILEHLFTFGEATLQYQETLRKKPNHAGAAYALGRLALTEEDGATALKYYQLCSDAMTRVGPAEVGMAASMRRLDQLDEARDLLSAIQKEPPEELRLAFRMVGDTTEDADVAVFAELGQIEFASGNHEEAIENFLAALDRNPMAWRVRFSLATSLQRVGRPTEAKLHFDRFQATKDALERCHTHILILREHPEVVESRYELGREFLEHVSEQQGLVWLNSVLAYEPNHRPTHQLLTDYFESKAADDPSFGDLIRKHRKSAAEPTTGPAGSETAPR